MNFINLQALLKLILSLLISILPVHNIWAQVSSKDGGKQVRVKMFKSINGNVQVIDTLINMADYAAALSSVKGFKADTAMLRKMNNSLRGAHRFDSAWTVFGNRGNVYHTKTMKRDTLVFQRLQNAKIRVYSMDGQAHPIDREKLFKAVQVSGMDTSVYRALKVSKVYVTGTDSLKHHIFTRHAVSQDGDTIRFQAISPVRAYSIKVDSIAAGAISTHRLKFSKNGSSGDGRVYIIGKDGKEHEVTTEKLELSAGDRTVVIMLKADVKDISEADKTKLKDAGNKVEASKLETLKIDDISFYPNPNDGRFNLSFALDKGGDATIRIFNVNGQLIYSENVKGTEGKYENQIDISGLGKGVFFLQVVQGNRYGTKKILVK